MAVATTLRLFFEFDKSRSGDGSETANDDAIDASESSRLASRTLLLLRCFAAGFAAGLDIVVAQSGTVAAAGLQST